MTGLSFPFIRMKLAYTIGLHFHNEWMKKQVQEMTRFEILCRYTSQGGHKVRDWKIVGMDAEEKHGLV